MGFCFVLFFSHVTMRSFHILSFSDHEQILAEQPWYCGVLMSRLRASQKSPAVTKMFFLLFCVDFFAWIVLCSVYCSCPMLALVTDSLHGMVYFCVSGFYSYALLMYLFKVHFKYSFYQFYCQRELLPPVCSTGYLLLLICYFWNNMYVCV